MEAEAGLVGYVGLRESLAAGRVRLVQRRPLVEAVEEAVHLEIGELADVAQRAGELNAAIAEAHESADEADAERRQGVEVERLAFRRAD